MLAAIVFTDVVGFSRLASQNEARVYGALQRDMGVMTSLCRAHGGQVLNTMGDGMLLCFGSAVDAMSCAIEIQRTLFAQSRSLPAQDILHHRIGVHLGDVIMNGDNVFGDGVNVAARLQAESKPDGICFSNTVHEVVKNKLQFDARYVGQRQLKNLGEPVKIWQVPPIEDRSAMNTAVDVPDTAALEVEEARGVGGIRGALLVVISLVLVGGVIAAALVFKPTPSEAEKPRVNANRDAKPNTEVPPPVTAPTGMTPAEAVDRANALRRVYDFNGLVQLLEAEGAKLPDLVGKISTYRNLAGLRAYVDEQIAVTNPSTPITVEFDGAQVSLYQVGGVLQTRTETNVSALSWDAISPEAFRAIAQALAVRKVDTTPAPAQVPAWISEFESEYGLSGG